MTTPSEDLSRKEAEAEAPPVTAAPQPPQFPEGGLQAWLTVLGGACLLFTTFGAVQSFGVYQEYYELTYLKGYTSSDISWIGSMQVFLLFAGGLPAGKLFDEGYFHHLIGFGSVLYLFSIFMLSLANEHKYYQIFLAQGVGMGLAMGCLFLPAVSITSHYFRRKRTAAMGVVLAGSSLGAVIYPIMLNNLFTKIGFGWGVRAAAFMDMGLLALANVIMKTRLPARKDRPNSKPVDVKSILTDGPYWMCVISAALVFWGLFFPFFYLQLFAELHGLSQKMSFYAIPIMNASSLFGRTLPNFLADVIGPFNVMIPCTIISGGIMWLIFSATTVGGTVAFGILYGFFSGGFISIITPAVASFSQGVEEIGMRIGFASFVIGFALLTGTPIAGALVQNGKTYVWYRPLIFASVVVLVGAAFSIYSRHLLAKRKGTKYV
ncbi:MFS general substrate transporter [Coniophora puteana RWD-64-598 SS2]|uniref:MFS general substrate transporter n=1 Tax=Coniophora puteana (strain RWD-64-598) TaxID=741705 RepID=A0A5M3MB86_CONPW|nr:MFS general substrate transporter [Coniophora puteana RWD-64-598 SS2]EIW75911.1 MFS general substrate transporter [Coniophora puteana RWD-64-598 SS2]